MLEHDSCGRDAHQTQQGQRAADDGDDVQHFVLTGYPDDFTKMRQVGAFAHVQVAVLAHEFAPIRFPLVFEQVPIGTPHLLALCLFDRFEFELDHRVAVLGPSVLALQADTQDTADQVLIRLNALEEFVVAIEEYERGAVSGGDEELGCCVAWRPVLVEWGDLGAGQLDSLDAAFAHVHSHQGSAFGVCQSYALFVQFDFLHYAVYFLKKKKLISDKK